MLDRTVTAIDRTLLTVGCVFLLLMMLHITVDVVLRSTFDIAIIGTLETVSYYHMIIAVFLPLAYVERTGANIMVDLFVRKLPTPVQVALYVVGCLVGLAFFGALTWQSLIDAIRSTERQETVMSNFIYYIWPARWALPIGFGAVFLAVLRNMLAAISRRQPL